MLKNFVLCLFVALIFGGCVGKHDTFAQVDKVVKNSKCYPCESKQGFEAKIKGLLYLSDVGIVCCADRRTLDTGVALKKVYLHRFYDLREEQKLVFLNGQKYYIDLKFNAIFYTYLEQELKNRGIIVLEDNPNSPYVAKVDLSFLQFDAKQNASGLHSKLVGLLHVSDTNRNKKFTLRTKQDVQGFEDMKDLSFYTHLLIKQMANKAASLISSM
ncbi:outer membrane lipoprotein MapA [Campylobacter sp.]|uniref:outer membrane lipoprotein MapA n=1 Tax=Campylobacter sp. TaxID=205 RepID=UPI0026DCF96B|nr:outer membrane lipoprotein MapA [Campylobacter sp.]MDO4674172.1 outer membrane lipoprotein MapA [Campylobacter sp.]